MHTPLRPQDIEVFTEAITHYFSASTGELASVRSAYLLERGGPVIWNDFNGLIEISGDYQGSICFSAPRALLSHVLLKMGESVFTDERHGDIVGEIAATLAKAWASARRACSITRTRFLKCKPTACPTPSRYAGMAMKLIWSSISKHAAGLDSFWLSGNCYCL